jgi:hypothetical protein
VNISKLIQEVLGLDLTGIVTLATGNHFIMILLLTTLKEQELKMSQLGFLLELRENLPSYMAKMEADCIFLKPTAWCLLLERM